MGRPYAWVLNLDADLELAAGGRYEPTKSVRAAMARHVQQFAASLLGQGDRIVDESSPPGVARGWRGRAFCPTPRALSILERVQAEPEPSPPIEVLRRVNSRAFASALGSTLPDAAFVTDAEQAREILGRRPSIAETWRIKHSFGVAGRNQRVVPPASRDARDLSFLDRGLRLGGVQIEPNVTIEDEYARHALLGQDGELRVGELVTQHCDARGAWTATERVGDPSALPLDIASRTTEEIMRVARALREAGYFGPFGVDAYTYRDLAGLQRFQPRSEINARYSMGFATGFGPPSPPGG